MTICDYICCEVIFHLVEPEPGHLVHLHHAGRGEVVAVALHLEAGQPGVHRGELGEVRGVRGQRVARLGSKG